MSARRSTIAIAVVCAAAMAALIAFAISAGRAGSTTREFTSEELSREACPDSEFECVTITVPRDHFDASDDEVWEVTYAIRRATGDRIGTFVTITGGPGSAGIASADLYTSYMSDQITEHYDLVFFNQRGSSGIRAPRCDESSATYYATPLDVSDRDSVALATEQFVVDCIEEGSIDVDDLPYYATRQAAADLELVRRSLGVDQLELYGESYGTQFVQTYAAAHPEHVASLFLDGVVDLTVDGIDWYEEAARAYDDALLASLEACDADEFCAADTGAGPDGDAGAALATYDSLASRLSDDPIEFDFPLPDGTTERRSLTVDDLEIAASAGVGSFGDRSDLLRAMNAAAGGNPVPLERLASSASGHDPDTSEVLSDPSYSDALYYAVECQDYSFFPDAGTPRERLDAWLDAYVAGNADEQRLGSVALGDLPCL